jgi:predicted ATPase
MRDVARGAQVVVATHSPVPAALPEAPLLEVGPWGIRETTWETTWSSPPTGQVLQAPDSFLRHLR